MAREVEATRREYEVTTITQYPRHFAHRHPEACVVFDHLGTHHDAKCAICKWQCVRICDLIHVPTLTHVDADVCRESRSILKHLAWRPIDVETSHFQNITSHVRTCTHTGADKLEHL